MDNKTVSHLEHQTVDGTQLNLDALYQICPSCFTETKGEDGQLKHVINFGKLRALLGDNAVEDAPEVFPYLSSVIGIRSKSIFVFLAICFKI